MTGRFWRIVFPAKARQGPRAVNLDPAALILDTVISIRKAAPRVMAKDPRLARVQATRLTV